MESTGKTLKPTELIARIDNLVEKDIVPNLEEFIRIPNLSSVFDKDYFTNGLMQKASLFILNWCKSQGIKGLTIDM